MEMFVWSKLTTKAPSLCCQIVQFDSRYATPRIAMNRPLTIVLLVAAIVIQTLFALPSAERDSNADEYKLPADLLIGAGLSAVQTEGAWDVDGKAESSVDWVLNTMKMDPNHKVAANSYNRFREDVKMAAELKLDLYKFSISWARVLPTADADAPNAAGVTFYNNLIDEIIAKGMTPMVTMYHFDHPRILEDKFKGWQDKQMADKFAEYAGFLFKTFGDRVKHWVTINEPNMYCAYFTNMYVQAGLRKREEVDQYECIHNNILAHMKARQVFKRRSYDGKLGYSTLLMYAQPATISPEDVYAANVFNELHAGSSLHPVVYGDYPQVFVANYHLKQTHLFCLS
ncbi:uncharacterized protein LOC113212232 [Frankliniella occidentalis]|uniref:Uncharacterized protein LOC113212232 n=1 Tax=Frankliniella occidentalis TaxID=133901 RepID=A0A9C6XT99_FRAOC|nr:uncharacterized protein LOC113212232 [Frankliniella occidentalis]